MHSVIMCLIAYGFWHGMQYGASSFLRRYEWVMCECPVLNLDNIISSFLDIFFVIFCDFPICGIISCSLLFWKLSQ